MDHSAVFSAIDRLYPDYLDMLRRMCDIESPTCDKAAVDSACSFVADWGRALGFEVEVFPDPSAGDVVAITMKGRNTAPLVLSGHMDTVHPRGLFGEPPTRIQGGRIIGPGVTDCKGGAVAAFLAMDALDKNGFRSRPVKLILQTDEEVSSATSNKQTIGYMCDRALESVAFLNLEGSDKGKACLIRKGTITFTFKIEGVEAHGSQCATKGANAILDAAHKIIELEKLKDDEGLTCNCGVISGGTVSNTVPGYCEFKANIRFANTDQLNWVREHVKSIAETVHVPGCKCSVNNPKGRVAMEYSEKNVALLARMNEIFAENDLPVLEAAKRKGASDAADVTFAGAACIDSLGVRGGKIHSPDEFAYIDSLAEAAKRLVCVAANI